MTTTVRLNSRGMKELLASSEVGDFLEEKMLRALSTAQSNAPVDTGAYRSSLHIERTHTDRVVVRVVSDVDHAMWVEAETGNLARALDAAR